MREDSKTDKIYAYDRQFSPTHVSITSMASISAFDDLPDGDLVRRAQAGERGAFDCLLARYRGLVQAMAFLRTSHRDEADDLAQEVWAKAWEKLPTLQEPDAFRGWVVQITMNACRNWYRRRVRWPESLDALAAARPLPDTAPGPAERLLEREHERRCATGREPD